MNAITDKLTTVGSGRPCDGITDIVALIATNIGDYFVGIEQIKLVLIIELMVENVEIIVAYVDNVVKMLLCTVDTEESLGCAGCYDESENKGR